MEIENNLEQEDREKKYNEKVLELQKQNSWSPRKAKRYLNSIMLKQTKKFIKKGIKRSSKIDKLYINPNEIEMENNNEHI